MWEFEIQNKHTGEIGLPLRKYCECGVPFGFGNNIT